MNKIAVSLFNTISVIGVTYIIVASLVGADTLVPHKYIIIRDGKKVGYGN